MARRPALNNLRASAKRALGDRAAPPPASGADAPSLSRLARWPAPPPEGYLGQLRDDYQAQLAAERAGLRREDCRFYHSMELPTGEVFEGPWDLRGHEGEYLGNVDLAGKRVLELGPATGNLTFWMEKQGAEVVCLDAGYDVSIDLLPAPGGETRQLRLDHFAMVSEFQNSWWYVHQRLGSKAKMVYGNIYDLPGDIGQFDVATFGAILLHLRSPIAALEQAARRTRDTIVVTDGWSGGADTMYENIMRPFPSGEGSRWVVWWEISAGAIIEMLKILGFGDISVTEHTQHHQHGHVESAPFSDVPMYTVVGHRP